MADQNKGAPVANGIIELENTSRSKLVWQICDVDKLGVPTVRKYVTIGDAADRICHHVDEDLRDVLRQPSPIVRWTKAEYDELGPSGQKTLAGYIANGTIRVTQGRELIGA